MTPTMNRPTGAMRNAPLTRPSCRMVLSQLATMMTEGGGGGVRGVRGVQGGVGCWAPGGGMRYQPGVAPWRPHRALAQGKCCCCHAAVRLTGEEHAERGADPEEHLGGCGRRRGARGRQRWEEGRRVAFLLPSHARAAMHPWRQRSAAQRLSPSCCTRSCPGGATHPCLSIRPAGRRRPAVVGWKARSEGRGAERGLSEAAGRSGARA